VLIKSSKLSDYRLKKLLRCFCEDLTATQTTRIIDINRNTVNRYYRLFRKKITAYQESISKAFKGEVELDESYFGGRSKGRRGRGTAKTPVFGLFKRNGRVYTEIVPNCKKPTLQAIIKGKIDKSTIIYSDKWRGYDGLVDVGYNKHFRVNHGNNEFSRGEGIHINGIENFWSFTKRRLSKFNGVKKNFELHLKECEWRYSRDYDILKEELWRIYKWYLKH